MDQKDKKDILYGVLLLFIILVFVCWNYFKSDETNSIINNLPLEHNKAIIFSIQEQESERIFLEEEKVGLFISKSLQPLFVIEKDTKISDIKIYFDNSENNLINDKFSDANVEIHDSGIIFSFPYTLDPKKHSFEISYRLNSQEIKEKYNFILVLYDDFSSSSLVESKYWGLATSGKIHNNWEIKEEKLTANPISEESLPEAISSLFFIRRFKGDFFIQFDLIPKSDKLGFVSYFFERKINFIFGGYDNKDINVIDKYNDLIQSDFIFKTNKIYKIKIIRKENIYLVYATEKESVDTNTPILIYEDRNQLNIPFDSFGFTIWRDSGGVDIDNFYAIDEYISDTLELDSLKK